MGYYNPAIPWSELERRLSDTRRPTDHSGDLPVEGDGGDSPAWSRHRAAYAPTSPAVPPTGPVVPYAELHCHSNFSFLDGASSPEELVEEAVRQGLTALAITDHDGFQGAVRLAEAAETYGAVTGLRTVFGAELSLGLPEPQNGRPDPVGEHLLLLAIGQDGYHRLSGAITEANLRGGQKGRPVYDLEELAQFGAGHWQVLTGCRKGAVRRALQENGSGGREAARRELDRLVSLFGADHVEVELVDHGLPSDTAVNEALAELADGAGLPVVATNNVHYATPERFPLATALAAVRARRSLPEIDAWLPASSAAHLRSGAEMAARMRRYTRRAGRSGGRSGGPVGALPDPVARAHELGRLLAFPLRKASPRLPEQKVPPGHDSMSWLETLCRRLAPDRYRGLPHEQAAHARLEAELTVIRDLGFPGYFLIVHEICSFARERGILFQGRGSAAGSAVCYVLGITAVDPVLYDLPFERFLSATRDEEPDIDVDFDSDRREEVIQHVFETYGRRNAAQVANVITYRPKSAIRDMAKALGHSTGQQDAWSKGLDGWSSTIAWATARTTTSESPTASGADEHRIPAAVTELAEQLLTFPRHLGIHSGGMVLTDRPVGQVVPIEHARMANRTILQWDKDDCAWMGLVKFDLLGLGILSALRHTMDEVADRLGERWTMATIPKEEPGVYDQLCQADSVGTFQVESRAQIGTLPRLRPRRFYDLVIEVALIRPGPIQGGAVHPFIRRRLGQEPVTYLHPALEPVLERTLGVPLFQEQLMQMAMAVGGFSGADADLLRRAMGSKRSMDRMRALRERLYAGMAENGIHGETADEVYDKIEAFANYGFAESHSISFALIVYLSTWLRLHYPAAYLTGLLRAQPMGFYSPQSLSADARRHGVSVLRPDLHASGVDAVLEPTLIGPVAPTGTRDPTGCTDPVQPPTGEFDPRAPFDSDDHRRDGMLAVRLGLTSVHGLDTVTAQRIVEAREADGPFLDPDDLVRRTGVGVTVLESLSTAGALECLGLTRREALWHAGAAAAARADHLPGFGTSGVTPSLPGMSALELTMADLWATGVTPDGHPMEHARAELRRSAVLASADLRSVVPGTRVRVAGVVTHRQRPATASGITFLNLEDETGMTNVVCTKGLWDRYRRVARESAALLVRGTVERSDGATNLLADRIERLSIAIPAMSRDFR